MMQFLKSRPFAEVLRRASFLSNGFRINGALHVPPLNNASSDIQRRGKMTIALPYVIPEPSFKFSEGNQYYNFDCIRVESVPEFGVISYTFRHRKTGTELWHVFRNDSNNVFAINFRTTPFDSTGLPHILEHVVLCGSKKFPIRDQFFKMLNRSVASYMNASTESDHTSYPFSTMNESDFCNLQKVYLDAVFSPNLAYLDFLQEGWRLEHCDIHDKSSEYVLKGVVYNEMKGFFSENSAIFGQSLLNNLLPEHTYGNVSGGNPLEIPKLTYANLLDFHAKYYHPSNARIYSYGNFDLHRTLAYVNDEYLMHYDGIENSYSHVQNQTRWDKPRYVHISSRFDSMGAPFEKQNQIAIAVLTSDITDLQESFVLELLAALLVRGPNSAFYKTLIEPNFSGGYNQKIGYNALTKDTYFVVGLKDVRVEEFDRVKEAFDSTLRNSIEEGFDAAHIESVLHNYELLLKHQNPNFGLMLLSKSASLWNHNGDVVSNLRLSNMIANFRHNLSKDPIYLQRRIEHYLANNPHRLTLTMSPDDHYEEKFRTAELELLKTKLMELNHKKREDIYENGLKLDEVQKSVQNLAILPCLQLENVLTMPKRPTIEVTRIRNVPTQVCNIHTNDVSYLKLLFSGAYLSHDEVMLIPLFCYVVTEMGTRKRDYREFDKLVLCKTAGIELTFHCADNIYDSKTFIYGVYFANFALDKNVRDMFLVCTELLKEFKLEDTERLNMLIENYVSNIAVGIVDAGHLYAMQSSAGLVTSAAQLKTQLAGVEHIKYMQNFVKSHKIEETKEKLKSVGSKIFVKGLMHCALSTSTEFQPILMEHYEKFLNDMPTDEEKLRMVEHDMTMLEPSRQHFVINVPVYHCSKSFYTVPYLHSDHPILCLLAGLITAKYLLPVIREQNAAYSAGARIGIDGIFHFYSYRDPNCTKTLLAFENTYQWLQQNNAELTDQTLFEAKLGVLQQLDAPKAPEHIGIDLFQYGITEAMFMEYRARMLSTTVDELKAVIERYFKDEPKHFGQCILGPEYKNLEKETNRKWKIIT